MILIRASLIRSNKEYENLIAHHVKLILRAIYINKTHFSTSQCFDMTTAYIASQRPMNMAIHSLDQFTFGIYNAALPVLNTTELVLS